MNRERKSWVLRRQVRLCLLLAGVFPLATTRVNAQDARPVTNAASTQVLTSLTAAERAWLRDHPVITLAHDPDWAPIEFSDERGELTGISGDYLNLVEQRLGVKFKRIPNLSWQEAFARQKRWEIDMATCVAAASGRSNFWAFTRPYVSIPIVIATHADVSYIGDMKELFGKKVAVVKSYAIDDWVTHDFPEINLVRFNTVPEGLAALQRGEVFAYLDNLLIIGDYQAKLKVANIKIAGQTPYVNAQRMAVRKDWAPLAGILDKALASIPERERQDIYRKWVPIRYEQGFDYALFWKVLAGFVVILLALVVWNRRLAREIRNRQRAETAQREVETRYRLLFEQSPDGVVILDPATARFLEFNTTAHRQLGYSREEFARLSLADLEAEETPEKTRGRIAKVTREGRDDFETRHRTRQGEIRIVHVTAQCTEIQGRSVYHCVWRDITESKRAEEALRQEKKFSQAVLDSLPGLFYLYDDEGHFLRWNKNIVAFTGYTDEEIARMSPLDFFLEADRTVVAERIQFAFQSGEARVEARVLPKNGRTPTPFLMTGKRIQINDRPWLVGMGIDITERKQAEAALREKTEELDRFFSTILDLYCVADTDGCFRRLNPQWEAVLGYPLAELEGRRFLDLVHPEDLEATLQAISRLDAQQPVLSFVNRYRCKDGTYRWLEWRSSPQGKLIYAAARDITERKQAEDALRESRHMLRSILDTIPARVFWKDLALKYVGCNRSFARDAGLAAVEDVIGKDDFDMAWAKQSPRYQADEQQLIAAGEPRIGYEESQTNLSGHEVWLRTSKVPLRDPDGRITGVLGTSEDITERRRAEDALRESEARFAVFMDNLPAGAFMKDVPGAVVYANRYLCEIFGWGNIIGRSTRDLLPPEVAEKMEAEDRAALAQGLLTLTEQVRDVAGRERVFQTSKFPIARAGRAPLLGGIAVDITERKQAEEALRTSLEEKVVLLKEVHHRVKNNLQIVSSLLNLQAAREKEPIVLDALRDTQHRVRSMALLHEMLYRSESLARVNFATYTRTLCAHLGRAIGGDVGRIKLDFHMTAVELGLELAVPCGLIIAELVSNALKHAFPDGRPGCITLALDCDVNQRVTLTVADDGVGLPVALEPAQTSTLGLQLVRILTAQLKGTLDVARGPGARFCLTFPVN